MVKNQRHIFLGQRVLLIQTYRSDLRKDFLILTFYMLFYLQTCYGWVPQLVTYHAWIIHVSANSSQLRGFDWFKPPVRHDKRLIHVDQKQKNKKNKKTKTNKKTVKHQCQVASPGGRSLSTETIIKFILFLLFCNNSPSA